MQKIEGDFIRSLEKEFDLLLEVTSHEDMGKFYVLVYDGKYRGGWASTPDEIREIAEDGDGERAI